MLRFAFKKGLSFACKATGCAWVMVKQTVTNKIEVESDQGETLSLTASELQGKWLRREWVVQEKSLSAASNVIYETAPRDLRSCLEPQQKDVARKVAYLRAIEDAFQQLGGSFVCTEEALKPKIDAAAKEMNDEKEPPSPRTVARWWNRFKPGRCVIKLIDARERSGRKRNATLLSIFEEAIAETFLTKQRHPSQAVWEAVKTKVLRVNRGVNECDQIRLPGRATIYRWLKDLYYELVQRARNGKAATQRELRAAFDKLKVDHILQRVEIDHTSLDILIIDEATKLILGRPWITLAIDRKSRCVVGFYVSFHAPSAFSVLYCLRQAILPKDKILALYPDVRSPWPCCGIFDQLACDNGMDLHARSLEAACFEMGIEILYCGVGHPEMKGAIERMMRTLNHGLIHRLPGTVFSNPDHRGDYPSEDEAAIDFKTLLHLLVKWIVDVYHNTPHRGLQGRTPLQEWLEGEKRRVIELPVHPQQLDTIVGGAASRTLFHYGIEYDSLRYNSALLQLARRKVGGTPELAIRFYEHDISYIDVCDPESGEFIRVPAIDQEYASGLNRNVHRLVRAAVCKRFGADYPHEDLLKAKEEIQAIVDQAVRATKSADRKKAASIALSDSNSLLDAGADDVAAATESVEIDSTVPDNQPPGLDDDLLDLRTCERALEEVAA